MKPVFIAASPNTQFDDALLAFKKLISPWSWYDKHPTKKFEQIVSEYHGDAKVIAFDSARTSFYEILRAFDIKAGDEVIIPAFSCLVIANPVLWVGAKPVYVDVDKDFNMDLDDLRTRITKRTKAILVQHTFGKPIDMDKLKKITGDKIKLIEDLAHSLGGEYKGKKLGTFGDAAILTFGIEKVISTVRGGMAITNDAQLAYKLRAAQTKAQKFSLKRLILSLLNPIFWFQLTPIYYLGFGKVTAGRVIVQIAHKLNMLGNMIEKCEYDADKPDWLPAQLPGALAELGIKQFKKLDKFNIHRQQIAAIYAEELGTKLSDQKTEKHIYLRYPLLTEKRDALIAEAKKHKVVLGDWYKSILYAPKFTWKNFKYEAGTAPNAEEYAAKIVNLPTAINVSPKAAKKIAGIVKKYL